MGSSYKEELAPAHQPSLSSFASHLTADFDTRPEQLAMLFNKLDITGSGNVGYDQMLQGIRPMFPNLREAQLRGVVEKIDIDGSGEVNQAEFITAIQEIAVEAFNRGTLYECFMYDYGPEVADRTQVFAELGAATPSTTFLARPLNPKARVRWVCTVGDQSAFILRMVMHYDLHPLIIQDILYSNQQAKIEKLGPEKMFVTYPMIKFSKGGPLDTKTNLSEYTLEIKNVSLLIIRNTILSFYPESANSIESCKSRISNSASKIRTAPSAFLALSLMQQEVEPLFATLVEYRKEIDIVEDFVDDDKPTPQVAIKLTQSFWRQMNVLMFHLRPMAATLRAMAEQLDSEPDVVQAVNQLRGRVEALVQQAESLQTLARSLKEDNQEKQTSRMNRTMHTLTIVTATLVPAQWLTGLWGMNFDAMPELHWEFGYKMFWILECSLIAVILLIFKLRGFI